MSEALNELASYLRETRSQLISDAAINYGELTLTTTAANLIELLT
ncbi:MAG: NADH-quinone oxidoreductase subunit C, partial [Ensifer adhaerens]